MKRILPLLALAVAFSSCTTLSNRRDLYAPSKPDAEYTKMLRSIDIANAPRPLGSPNRR